MTPPNQRATGWALGSLWFTPPTADGVLAEVDCNLHHSLSWTQRIAVLAHRRRAVLIDGLERALRRMTDHDHPTASGPIRASSTR